MVVTNKLYSPQEFVEVLTGKYYTWTWDNDNDIEVIHDLLYHNGIESDESPLWDYPLNEIAHIVENNINVVLVDVAVWNEETEHFEHELRWFEIPVGTCVDFEEV